MAKLLTVETAPRGGGGFGAPDVSDDLNDMGNYEAAINKKEIFEMLAQLKVMEKDTDRSKYQFLVLDVNDIEDFDAKSMGAAGHGINSQFAVLNGPYRAIPYADKTVQVETRIAKKGKHAGKEVKGKQTNCIKIYRTGEEFDSSLYAVEGWGKTNDKGEELTYESYTKGQELRAEKFLATISTKLLKAVGIAVEEK